VLTKFSGKIRHLLSRWQQNNTAPITFTPVLLASIGVTALLLALRQGVTLAIPGFNLTVKLEPLELGAYDQMVRSRPPEKTDPRLLVVGVTEEDIQNLGTWPISDAKMTQLLQKLEQHKPRVIGLDIYRDIPVPPGHSELIKQLQKSDRLVAICKLGDTNSKGVSALKILSREQIGFSDLVIDRDGVVRRALLFAGNDGGKCNTKSSFSFQLANKYLSFEGIESYKVNSKGKMGLRTVKPSPNQQRNVVFPQLDGNAGSYQGADMGGYQILLNYRSAEKVAREVSLTEVLNDRVPPEWIRDRIILIGVFASSIDDAFYTPYSAAQTEQHKMPGIVIHAQIVSQIISAILDDRPLPWYWSDWAEALWIWGWALIGGIGAGKLRHPLWLGLFAALGLVTLTGISYNFWLQSGWIPLVPAALGMLTTGSTVVVIAAHQMQQEREKILSWAKEQEETIALLTTMYKRNLTTTMHHTLNGNGNEEKTLVTTTPLNSDEIIKATAPKFSERYEITKILGQGGFGRTYLAKDRQDPKALICVVKHLMPARRDPKFLEVARRLFQTEAKILKALGQHDRIPELLDYIEKDEEFYLVEEYIEGEALSEELQVDQRWSETQVVSLLQDLLPVLDFIHQHHVIHRDLKPGNIIRRKKDNKLVLIDFGAVKQMLPSEGGKTESQTVAIGTKGYAPPEQLVGHPRPASDIYALGMIGIQALTGIQPHDLLLLQDLETGNLNWRNLAKVNDPLAEILNRMVQYHFSDRYHCATEVLTDLQKLDPLALSQTIVDSLTSEILDPTVAIPLTESDTTSLISSWTPIPVHNLSSDMEALSEQETNQLEQETPKNSGFLG